MRSTAVNIITLLLLLLLVHILSATTASGPEARHYEKIDRNRTRCLLCPRQCLLSPGATGYCRVRHNVHGKLISLVYGRLVAANVDPIEKKPLFHFLPGSKSLSIATVGCSMRCLFCQNWDISQAGPEDFAVKYTEPGQVVRAAIEKGCLSISYTYNEPAVFYEYMYDISALAGKRGLRNVMVTSGHFNPGPAVELGAVLDAASIDLKGFSEKNYQRLANTRLQPILQTVMALKRSGVWIEMGYLVIPTINDGHQEIDSFCRWVADSLGRDVPLHFLRFFPQHKLSHLPPTPPAALDSALAIARRNGLRYVYIGNLPQHPANHTYCHHCRRLLIKRQGYFIEQNLIHKGCCPDCGTRIPGVWK